MKMKMARRTSALGRVEAERHQANEQRAYSSFGESLHKKRKKMKHMAWSEKKNAAHSHLCPSWKEKGKLAHMRC